MGDFLMTYDGSEEVKEMTCRHKFQIRLIPMKTAYHLTIREVVIGRDIAYS